jgi:hypothetical protein
MAVQANSRDMKRPNREAYEDICAMKCGVMKGAFEMRVSNQTKGGIVRCHVDF